MGWFDFITDPIGDLLQGAGDILGEIPKAITRPIDKLFGTSTTGWVDDFILPAAMAIGGQMVGIPAPVGAGIGRAVGGLDAREDPLDILKNSLSAAGATYGGQKLIGWPGSETMSLPFTGGEAAGAGVPGTFGPGSSMPLSWGGPAVGEGVGTGVATSGAGVSGDWASLLGGNTGGGGGLTSLIPKSVSDFFGAGSNVAGTTAGAGAGGGGGMTGGIWDWITKNPGTAMMGANILGSLGQSGMYGDINEAQQKSYQDYLGMINPPAEVKAARYGDLSSNVREQGDVAESSLMNKLASRGIRGKGLAAPSGDLAEAERKMMQDAYNQVYGTYNVPSAPGPVDYSPDFLDLMMGNVGQAASQGIPLALILSKYGVGK